LGTSEQLSAEKAALLQEAGHVDVMVLCPEANVQPIIRTLDLPPQQDDYVTFTVTPRIAGQINLTIALLLRNEPIHRTVFSCDAVAATTSVTASSADPIVRFKKVESSQNEMENNY
jgi:hypothetical protein